MTKKQLQSRKTLYEVLIAVSIFALIVFGFVFSIHHRQSIIDTTLLTIFICIFMLVVIILLVSGYLFKVLKKTYKAQYVVQVFQTEFPTLIYRADEGLDKEDIYRTGMLKKASRFRSEDYISGKISGMRFESADIHLEELRSTGKSSYYVTVFQGRYYKIYLDKSFASPVFVLPKHYHRFNLQRQFETFDVESIEFSNSFKTYAHDHHQALMIVKPIVIDRILAFSKTVKQVMLGFENQTIYIAVDDRIDHFDMQLFRPIKFNVIDHIKAELKLTEDLIELLT